MELRCQIYRIELACIWTCPICGKDEPRFQALAAHRAVSHGVLREARTRVLDGRCSVCLRDFHSRERLVDHLHKASPICLLNTLLFLPRLNDDFIVAADKAQRERGTAARARGVDPTYAQQIVRQKFGPWQTFLIPMGHSRESRYPLFEKALKDTMMSIAADFAAIKTALSTGSRSDIMDEIPLVMLPRLRTGG